MTGEIAGEKELSGYQGLLGGSVRAGGMYSPCGGSILSDVPCAVIRRVFFGGLGSRKASTFHFLGGCFFCPQKRW